MPLMLPAVSATEYSKMKSAALRRTFVIDDLFKAGSLCLRLWETDRTVLGGAVPTSTPLRLEAPADLRAKHFNDRRELGIINLGGAGHVKVDGKRFPLGHLDTLYVGRGVTQVVFTSRDAKAPARYYLLSYPAHAVYPTRLARRADLSPRVLGAAETENHRILHQVIHEQGIRSCQLVMGFTLVQPGSKWNTMPPHVHDRRSEVYCYFGFPRGGSVKHFMGNPKRIRTLRGRCTAARAARTTDLSGAWAAKIRITPIWTPLIPN
jgi:4-deoxy-L-threo-5-hexosulose-uronate ketol-isomerase